MPEPGKEGGITVFEQEHSSLTSFDLVCFSHLRWNSVYQRPQHLLSRCAQERRVFFVEEPIFAGGPYLDIIKHEHGLRVVIPHLPEHMASTQEEVDDTIQQLLDELCARYAIEAYVLWYYTPMAMSFSKHLKPLATIYDCMDELSAFQGASPLMREHEALLFRHARLVFTGGYSLYKAKCRQHPHVYAFPSSVDTAHFERARGPQDDPSDQAGISHPRLGFYGVIDERFDVNLLQAVADAQPDWQFVIIGPVAKIDAGTLPHRNNIHYLGEKSYNDLPAYLAGWDVALLPFAHNAATRYISPTKTLEYLAAGKLVISTSIHDVVRPYGEQGLVYIADTPTDFVTAVQRALNEDASKRLHLVDSFLAQTSWDSTWSSMRGLIEGVLAHRTRRSSLEVSSALATSSTRSRRGGLQ